MRQRGDRKRGERGGRETEYLMILDFGDWSL